LSDPREVFVCSGPLRGSSRGEAEKKSICDRFGPEIGFLMR